MIAEISYRKVCDQVRIDVMFDDCNIFECYIAVDEIIVETASPIIMNSDGCGNTIYSDGIKSEVKWCEEHFDDMMKLYVN